MNKLIKKTLLCASALTLMIATGVASAAPLSGFVYTANERDASISEIALETGQVRTFKAPIVAHNVQITPDGAFLLAVGMTAEGHEKEGAHDAHGMQKMEPVNDEGKLMIFDVRNLDKPVASLPAGKHPAHVVTDREGQRAFVTSAEENAITVLDLARRKVVGKIDTGASPHGLRPSPDGKELYVANIGDDSVLVVNTTTLKVVARIPVGKAPAQVGFTPDGRQVYVSLSGENKVAIIDVATRQVIGKVDVGRSPIQVYATSDGKTMYVANQGSEKAWDDKVSVIDIASRKVIAAVTTGPGAHGVVVDSSGKTAFVTNIDAGTVSAIDTNTQQVTSTFKVGAGPNGISYRRK
ncbi:MAG TPA: cytochrome D1 domain-containing protein [Burkholderiaceae bacterium]|nr:cytochrome D1 domain-containing protein [Burkholderiaceae bacterium]